jgi:hypothetical protein
MKGVNKEPGFIISGRAQDSGGREDIEEILESGRGLGVGLVGWVWWGGGYSEGKMQ